MPLHTCSQLRAAKTNFLPGNQIQTEWRSYLHDLKSAALHENIPSTHFRYELIWQISRTIRNNLNIVFLQFSPQSPQQKVKLIKLLITFRPRGSKHNNISDNATFQIKNKCCVCWHVVVFCEISLQFQRGFCVLNCCVLTLRATIRRSKIQSLSFKFIYLILNHSLLMIWPQWYHNYTTLAFLSQQQGLSHSDLLGLLACILI